MKKNKTLIALLLASGLLVTGCNSGSCSHVDEDNNHLCDNCGETISECADENNDHKCDVCGEKLSECADGNKDHKCDLCGETISECADKDKDHKCDVCEETISECIDEDKDHKCDICEKDLPYVESVEIEDAVDELGVGSSVTLSANVSAFNGGSKEVEWSTESKNITLKDNGDGTVTVTGVAVGSAVITVKSKSDASVTDSVSIEIKNWSKSDLDMMESYLKATIPYFSGKFVWTDYYFETYGCITAESKNKADLELAVAGLEAGGVELEYDKNEDLYYADFEVPGSVGLILTFNVYVDGYGYTVVDTYSEYIAVACESWPTDYINQFTPSGIETVVPAAEGTDFEFKGGGLTGVYFYSVYVKGDMNAYLSKLEENSFEVVYDSYYKCYTAKKSGLLIDVYESTVEGKFVISSYAYAEWPGEELAEATTNLFGEAKEIPSFTALDFVVRDYSAYEMVLLSSMDSEPIEDYLDRLEELEWTIRDNGGTYEAIAPTQEYAMTIEFDTDYNGISLSIYPHSPVAVEWPEEFVSQQIELLGAEGSVPAYSSENVEGYSSSEPSFGYGPLIIIYAPASVLDGEVVAYAEQLREAGYFVVGDNYGAPVYAQEGTTLGISPYVAFDGSAFYIELLKLDEPAEKPIDESQTEGDFEDFPVSQIQGALGTDFVEMIPVAEGSSFSFGEDGAGGYNLTVYGGDRNAYVELLATSSLIHDEVPASASHAAYDSFYTSDFSKGIDVYAADENGTYIINLWAY